MKPLGSGQYKYTPASLLGEKETPATAAPSQCDFWKNTEISVGMTTYKPTAVLYNAHTAPQPENFLWVLSSVAPIRQIPKDQVEDRVGKFQSIALDIYIESKQQTETRQAVTLFQRITGYFKDKQQTEAPGNNSQRAMAASRYCFGGLNDDNVVIFEYRLSQDPVGLMSLKLCNDYILVSVLACNPLTREAGVALMEHAVNYAAQRQTDREPVLKLYSMSEFSKQTSLKLGFQVQEKTQAIDTARKHYPGESRRKKGRHFSDFLNRMLILDLNDPGAQKIWKKSENGDYFCTVGLAPDEKPYYSAKYYQIGLPHPSELRDYSISPDP